MSELCILCTAHNRRGMSLRCQLPASCALAWPVQQFSDRRTHAQLNSVYLPSMARAGHVISEPRLPPALAQFTSGGRREPGDEASEWLDPPNTEVLFCMEISQSTVVVKTSEGIAQVVGTLHTSMLLQTCNFCIGSSITSTCKV